MASEKTIDLEARIERDFTYHPPKGDQATRNENLRDAAKDLALLIVQLTPASREQSLALTNLEQAVMWACTSIARNE
jgi:hypothetical protein